MLPPWGILKKHIEQRLIDGLMDCPTCGLPLEPKGIHWDTFPIDEKILVETRGQCAKCGGYRFHRLHVSSQLKIEAEIVEHEMEVKARIAEICVQVRVGGLPAIAGLALIENIRRGTGKLD